MINYMIIAVSSCIFGIFFGYMFSKEFDKLFRNVFKSKKAIEKSYSSSSNSKPKMIFVSQPMSGLSFDQVVKDREKARKDLEKIYGHNIVIINNLKEDCSIYKNRIDIIADDIHHMVDADLAYFIKNWKDHNGCLIEYKVAESYGLDILTEEDAKSWLKVSNK